MNRLPPHLRPVLGLRSLLPRIGGAGYMMVPSESQLPVMGGSNGLKATHGPAAAAGTEGSQRAGSAADGSAPTSPMAAAAAAAAAADAHASVSRSAGAAKAGVPPLKPPLAPLSPRAAAAATSRRTSARGHSAAGSGTTTPPGGGSVHAGLLYRQGTVGAALVAEALRQEVAEQLAAAAAATARGGLGARGRSRSLSPLPARGSRPASRGRLTSPDDEPLPGPARPAAPGAVRAPSPPPPGMAGLGASAGAPIFPGLRRAGSGRSEASGASTPRLAVPLPQPPPRRSTSLSARAQQQIDLLQPLLDGSRRASADGAPPPR